MSDETTPILESLSIDGPIGIGPAIGIGLVLAVAFAALLWSQRRATGPAWASAFWVLRVVATAVILWMLLGPTWVTQRRTTKPQSIAVIVDTSESMDVSDPPSARQLRWEQAASKASAKGDPTVACDRAVVALRAALTRSQSARQVVKRHQASKEIRQHCESIGEAVSRAVVHLEEALTSLSSDASGQAERVLTLLEGHIQPDVREVIDSLDRTHAVTDGEVEEVLLSIEDALVGAERRLSELTRSLELAAAEASEANGRTGGGGMTRREHVAGALDAVRSLDDESQVEPVNIKAYRFDSQVAAVSLAEGWNAALQETDFIETATSNEAADDSAVGTNLTAALDQLGRAASAESIRSAILFSDGSHNAIDALAPQEVARTLAGIPVHVVPIGNTEILRDVLLYRVDAPSAVVEKDSILIDVIVTAFECAGESSKLVLRQNGEQIDEQVLKFDTNRTDTRVSFEVDAPELGRQEFELSIEPLEEESSTTNNVAFLTVNVVQDTLRVLLVDRIAQWEFRYLDQLFRRDESVTFEKLLFQPEVRATGKIAETGALPRDIEGWANYDVVILGDLETRHFDEESQKSLDEFVRTRGGHLIVIAGPENMPQGFAQQPLMDLLPVEQGSEVQSKEALKVVVTPAGKNHPALTLDSTWPQSEKIWKEQYELQPLYSLSEYSRPKPTTETWLEVESPGRAVAVDAGENGGPEHAFLCWHQVGAGRVVYLSAPATYRLRFRRGDRYHHRFWGQLMRWLTASERAGGTHTVRITTDRVRYDEGAPVAVTARLSEANGNPLRGAPVTVTAIAKEGPSASVDLIADEKVPGRYLGTFPSLPAGAYRLVPTGSEVERLLADSEDKSLAEARINVAQTGSIEQLNTRCNISLLRQIAEVTGGQVVPPTAIDEIMKLCVLAPEVSERVERQPLWNRWSYLAIAFACLCTEWVARKRLGLV